MITELITGTENGKFTWVKVYSGKPTFRLIANETLHILCSTRGRPTMYLADAQTGEVNAVIADDKIKRLLDVVKKQYFGKTYNPNYVAVKD